MTKTYLVEGMSCGGCVTSVTNAIKAHAEGAEISVDLETGKVSVENGPDEAVVGTAVEDAGFDYKGVAA
jgi:copper chaperone